MNTLLSESVAGPLEHLCDLFGSAIVQVSSEHAADSSQLAIGSRQSFIVVFSLASCGLCMPPSVNDLFELSLCWANVKFQVDTT